MDWLYQVTNAELSSLGQTYPAELSKIGVHMNLKSLETFIDATNRLAYSGVAGTLSSYTQVHPSSVFVLRVQATRQPAGRRVP